MSGGGADRLSDQITIALDAMGGDASGLEGEAGGGDSFHAYSIGRKARGRKYRLEVVIYRPVGKT